MGVAHVARVYPQLRWYKLLPDYDRTHLETNLGFASRCLRRYRSLLHPEHRHAMANRRVGIWNHSPLWSCIREGELGFWEALRTTTQVQHHGSSSFQVGRCSIPQSLSPPTLTGLLQHCHQQLHLQTNDTCNMLLFAGSSCSASTYLAITHFHSSCCLVDLVCLSYM
jgi:hypothetical protein